MVPALLDYNRRVKLINRFLAVIGVGGIVGAVVWGLTAWGVIDEGVAWIGAGAVIAAGMLLSDAVIPCRAGVQADARSCGGR